MVIALPSRVMNYKVSAVSPTEELITIGQILSEVGDYACTILDKEHLSFARKCANRLKKVVGELVSRGSIKSQDDLYEIQKGNDASADLSTMTIDELHKLYRQWPIRHQERLNEGREHMTYYFEGQIVKEFKDIEGVRYETVISVSCHLTWVFNFFERTAKSLFDYKEASEWSRESI